jgi:putative Holliday junction resolvase
VRILAMDVGDKRIGMAVSDCMGCTAQGIQTLERQTKHIDRVKVQNIIEKYNPEKIVIGFLRIMLHGIYLPSKEYFPIIILYFS